MGGPVTPEVVGPQDPAWQRHHLHSAANAWHVQDRLGATDAAPVVYKVAWVGGCVLYDVAKLRVMERHGGCGVLPSGAYHQQLTTVEDRGCDAPQVLRMAAARPGTSRR